MVSAIINLYDDRNKLEEMGVNARNLAVGMFDKKMLAEKFVKVLEETYAQKSCN